MGLTEAERLGDELTAVRKQLQGSGFYEVLSLHLNTCFSDRQVLTVLQLHLNTLKQALMFIHHGGE